MESHAASDALLVDIGGDIGALVVYAPAELLGQEIEIAPVGAGAAGGHVHPVHNVVRARRVGGHVLHAAVFPDLPAGDYLPWRHGGHGDPPGWERPVTVTGGSVTEVSWAPAPWVSAGLPVG